jgi:hypothetical protein
VFGDVSNLGGCARCDPTNTTCEQCADFFSLTPDGGCQLDACVEAPDGIEGDYETLGGCRRCNDEHTACLECHNFFGLSSDGRCQLCDPERFTDALVCIDCDGDDPAFCTDCSGNIEGDNEFGYYANAQGRCTECPAEDCMACENLTGACTRCKEGQGVQPGGACKPCKGPARSRCRYCDGDAKRCSECERGYFPDPKSGRCRACPPNCNKCTSAKKCDQCSGDGFGLNATTGLCAPCVEGCIFCQASADQCEACDLGYTNTTDGGCARCSDPRCVVRAAWHLSRGVVAPEQPRGLAGPTPCKHHLQAPPALLSLPAC